MRIIVIAKAPVPGRVKTRLCPPCTPPQAAAIAVAALHDTLRAATNVPDARTVLVLDGPAGSWIPPDIEVIAQRGAGLDERIGNAFGDVGAPALLIGMDTPHVTSLMLARAIDALRRPGVDAVLGDAVDGGWWAAGITRNTEEAFVGVPMSTPVTGRAQRSRFESLGWRVASLPRLRDVDTFDDAVAVAASAPFTRFARTLSAMQPAAAIAEAGA